MSRIAAPLALLLLALAPQALANGYSGSCSTCAAATTGLPYTVPSWSFASGCPRPSLYNSKTGSAPTWSVPVGLCCGVDGYPPCPAISCAYSFSYSSSGPTQCASSYAVIKAASVSQTRYSSDIKPYIVGDTQSYCATYPPTQASVIAHAAAQASAIAEATATTLIYHNQMVCLNKFQGGNHCQACSSCNGGSASTAVKAAVQAVATAAAEAWAGAYAEILNSGAYDPHYGDVLASADADAAAVANAINIAFDEYYSDLSIGNPLINTAAKCQTDAPSTLCKTAIAKALTCVFVRTLAKVYTEPSSGIIQPDSTSCANSYSISYSIGANPVALNCPYLGCVAQPPCPGNAPADGKPTTCLEAKLLGAGQDGDGEVTLYLGTDKTPRSVYCYQMDTCTPTEWLTLKNVDSSTDDRTYNYLAYGPPGLNNFLTCNKPAREQYYLKVRLDVAALAIVADAVNPFMFNNGGGFYENDGCSRPNDNLHYGKAAGCQGDGHTVGRANIDLRSTGFSVSPTAYPSSAVGGFNPYSIGAPYTFSSGTQVVDLNAGGYCGFFGPTVLPLLFTV